MDGHAALAAADFAVGFEVMRQVIRHHLKTVPLNLLAKSLGVTPDVLWSFMEGAPLPVAVFQSGKAQKLAAGLYPVTVEPEAVALNYLADTFPEKDRPRVRRALAQALLPVLQSEGRHPETIVERKPE